MHNPFMKNWAKTTLHSEGLWRMAKENTQWFISNVYRNKREMKKLALSLGHISQFSWQQKAGWVSFQPQILPRAFFGTWLGPEHAWRTKWAPFLGLAIPCVLPALVMLIAQHRSSTKWSSRKGLLRVPMPLGLSASEQGCEKEERSYRPSLSKLPLQKELHKSHFSGIWKRKIPAPGGLNATAAWELVTPRSAGDVWVQRAVWCLAAGGV